MSNGGPKETNSQSEIESGSAEFKTVAIINKHFFLNVLFKKHFNSFIIVELFFSEISILISKLCYSLFVFF